MDLVWDRFSRGRTSPPGGRVGDWHLKQLTVEPHPTLSERRHLELACYNAFSLKNVLTTAAAAAGLRFGYTWYAVTLDFSCCPIVFQVSLRAGSEHAMERFPYLGLESEGLGVVNIYFAVR